MDNKKFYRYGKHKNLQLNDYSISGIHTCDAIRRAPECIKSMHRYWYSILIINSMAYKAHCIMKGK